MNPMRTLLDKLAPLSLKIQGLRVFRLAGRRLRPAITVRAVNEAEACQALALIYQAEADFQAREWVTPFVAYHGPNPIGFVELVRRDQPEDNGSGHWLFSLYVRNRYRGLGIGEALCQAVIDRAVAEGAPTLSLFVHAENYSAQALYRKLGFALVQDEQALQRLGYIHDPDYPTVAMQKALP